MTQIISQLGSSDPASAFGSNTLPDFAAVLGEWWLGGSADASRKNAITAAMGTVIGSPAWGAGFATFATGASGAPAGITTDIKVTGPVTIVALVRTGTGLGLVAHSGHPASMSYSLSTTGSSASMGAGHLIGATDQAILAIDAAPAFNFVVGVSVLNQPGLIYKINAAGTTSDVGANQYLPTSRPDSFLILGAGGDANNAGTVDVAAVAVLSEARPQSYAEALYPAWKAFAQSRGLTVA